MPRLLLAPLQLSCAGADVGFALFPRAFQLNRTVPLHPALRPPGLAAGRPRPVLAADRLPCPVDDRPGRRARPDDVAGCAVAEPAAVVAVLVARAALLPESANNVRRAAESSQQLRGHSTNVHRVQVGCICR